MSLARAISRGRALKARFAVNGMKKASRSLGTAVPTELCCAAALGAWAMCRLAVSTSKPEEHPLSAVMTKEGAGLVPSSH